ncbi:MAG: hypothetical protein R3B67_03165 [Phycisphaerales bacterium]
MSCRYLPALLKSSPRTGLASELVKQVMGLLMMAAAAYFGTSVISLRVWARVEPSAGQDLSIGMIGLVSVATGCCS